jgi:DNA-binding NtrC family response regulator
VLEAANGGEAVLISQEYKEAINLLLTDVVMPRMSGLTVAEHLSKQRSGLGVLYMSGYTDDATAVRGIALDEAAFIEKPFSPDGLARKVRRVLDARAS